MLFSLPDAAPARLELLDVSGRSIEARDVGSFGAGNHAVTLGDRRTLSPGIYLLRLTRGGRAVTARAAVLRSSERGIAHEGPAGGIAGGRLGILDRVLAPHRDLTLRAGRAPRRAA